MSANELPHDVMTLTGPSWWPLATLWWVLLAIVVILLIGLTVVIWRARQRSKPLRTLQARWQSITQPNSDTILQMSEEAKKLLIRRYGRDKVAALSGRNWLKFLDEQVQKPVMLQQAHLWQCALYGEGLDLKQAKTVQRAMQQWLAQYMQVNKGKQH